MIKTYVNSVHRYKMLNINILEIVANQLFELSY